MNKCCGCCQALLADGSGCETDTFFLFDNICIPGGALVFQEDWCCSREGTQYTQAYFTMVSSITGATITGNYVRITRYQFIDGIRTPVSDEISGTWRVIYPATGCDTSGSYSIGGLEPPHPFIGCRFGNWAKYAAVFQISVPSACGIVPFADILAYGPEQFCANTFAIEDHRRVSIITNGTYRDNAGVPQFSFNAQVNSNWTSEGPCSGGCAPTNVVLTGNPDLDPINPGDGTGTNPGGGTTLLTGQPEDAF